MINNIEKFGRTKIIALITIISITSSIILTFVSMELFNGGMNQAAFYIKIAKLAVLSKFLTHDLEVLSPYYEKALPLTGFILSMEYLENYGIQLSISIV